MAAAFLGKFLALIEIVEDGGRLGVEPDMPAPAFVADLLHRLDGDAGAGEMVDPGLEHAAQPVLSGAPETEVEHGIVVLVALPIERAIVLVQHVELDALRRDLGLGQQAAEIAEAAGDIRHLHGLLVGQQDGALVQADRLATEKQLRRPQADGIGAVLEDVAQDHPGHLMDEQRRHRHPPLAEEVEIAPLDRSGLDKQIAEGENDLVVLARVGVGKRRDAPGLDGKPGVGEKILMQRDFGFAGFRHRLHLRPS